jgi:hypothetical protein
MSDATRRLICERCGAPFGCGRDAAQGCWCAGVSFRLPMPLPPPAGRFGDCLCPSCLGVIAAALGEARRTG